jgi:hypothetical protein
MTFRRKGDKTLYSFVDRRCIGRPCWSPGAFQHRAPVRGGSMNTSSPPTQTCMNRAYHGCPDGPEGEKHNDDGSITVGLPLYQIELAKQRRAEGWRLA